MEGSNIKRDLSAYDESYMIERDYLPNHMLNSLKHFLQKNKVRKILEVGVGSGKLMNVLREMGYEVEGIDISQASAQLTGVRVASATKIPFKENEFDCVLGISIIEHLTQKEGIQFVDEAMRVLKNNGVFFLVTPNFSSPLRYIQGKKWFAYSDKTHIFFYSPRSLKSLLRSRKFRNVSCLFKTTETSIEWPLPAFFKSAPFFFRYLVNFFLISTPLALLRDSFWISGKKKI